MKLSNKYIAFASVALLMASCDLDKYPESAFSMVGTVDEIREKARTVGAI